MAVGIAIPTIWAPFLVKFKNAENEFDLEAWLFYKNSQLYESNIDPAVFETEVELYFKIDFELMLLNIFPK